ESVTGRVWFGDGSAVEIKGKGTLLFQCKNDDQLMVSNVYFIPALTSNIFSLGQLTEVGYDVWLHNEYLRVYNQQGTLVLKVQQSSNRLYKMALKVAKPACLAASLVDDAWTWHARLGHANFYTLEMLGKKRMVTGMPCRASKPLELVHPDLCGLITPQSTGGIGGGSGMAEQSPSSSSGSVSVNDTVPFDTFDDTPIRETRLLQEIYEREPMMTEEEVQDKYQQAGLLLLNEEPTSFHEATKDIQWMEAMRAEIDSIEKNRT
nr:zinc finger, CCHC-type [Tanacetum cinerariifolium]